MLTVQGVAKVEGFHTDYFFKNLLLKMNIGIVVVLLVAGGKIYETCHFLEKFLPTMHNTRHGFQETTSIRKDIDFSGYL